MLILLFEWQRFSDRLLDPFSSEAANEAIRAKRIFTLEDSGIDRRWSDTPTTVFINPPYGRATLRPAMDTFLANLPVVSQGIVLVNNATETGWFQRLIAAASAMCLVNGRISFYADDGKAVSRNTCGQVFVYFGGNVGGFAGEFGKHGRVVLFRSGDWARGLGRVG